MENQNIDYKYSEDRLVKELAEYINKTYDQHYSANKFQATEFIIDGGHGIGFTIGNIMKYAQRYQHKGTPDDWRKDLLKVLHYGIIALHIHDLDQNKRQAAAKIHLSDLLKQPVVASPALPNSHPYPIRTCVGGGQASQVDAEKAQLYNKIDLGPRDQ